jgi:hypothetical protein
MSLGRFSPAPVQRGFEWDIPFATRLLNDIDKVVTKLEAEEEGLGDTDELNEQESEDADSDAVSIEAAISDFAFDENAADTAIGQVAGAERAPAHYFIGNIILSQTGARTYEVYDGLQRLTTLTILVAVLRDLIEDAPMRAELDRLIVEQGQYRVHLPGRDTTLVEHVQAVGATGIRLSSRAYYEVGRRILRIKNALRERIAEWDDARRIGYARFLLSSVWTSALEVNDVRMARQMFVSTNLYGKPLQPIDLLKGQIADSISVSCPPEAMDQFRRDWEDVRQVSGAAFEEMLKAVDAIERSDTQDDAWPTELGDHLARAYPSAQIGRFVRRLSGYAHAWRDCKRILMRAGPSTLEQNFWRLHVFWWPEWHGLALRWWNEVNLLRQTGQVGGQKWRMLESRFRRLHRRCMAVTLLQCDEADRQAIFMRALRQDKAGRDVFTGALAFHEPQRRKIDRTLRSQIHKEEIWAPLIRWIEIAEWRERLADLIRSTNTEHVRPRRPEADDDHAEDVRRYDEGCYSLGNLAVITREANARVLNGDFAHKLEVLREEARRFGTMHSVVYDADGVERSQWTDADIAARTEMLRHKVWDLLGLKPPV